MNNSVKLALGLMLLCGSLQARVTKDMAFIDAVRYGEMETVETLFSIIKSTSTFDRALRAAARNANKALFDRIAPFASPRGLRKGEKSLARHMGHCSKHTNLA